MKKNSQITIFPTKLAEYIEKIPDHIGDSEFVKNHKATQGDNKLSFDEYKVKGDGNCGFSALGVSRQDAVKILSSLVDDEKTRTMIVEELLRSMDNFRTSSTTESDPTQFMDSKIQQKLRQSYDELRQLRNKLTTDLKKLHQLLQDKSISLADGGNTEENILNQLRKNCLDNSLIISPELKKNILNTEKDHLKKLQEILTDKNIFNAYIMSYNVDGKGLWLGTTSMIVIAKAKKIGLNLWSRNNSLDELQLLPESVSAGNLGSVNILIIGGHYNFLVENQRKFTPKLALDIKTTPTVTTDPMSTKKIEQEEKKTSLQKINWNNKSIKEKDLPVLISTLQHFPSVSCLYLSSSHLRISHLKTLFLAISEHKGIYDLNLRDNMLAGEAKIFQKILDCFTELKMLNLNQTQLNKECIEFLSKALSRHSQLSQLDIGFNNLKDESLEPLFAALEMIQRPFDLRIAGNLLTEKTANCILKLLIDNRLVFSHLTIDNNPKISKSKIEEIKNLIKAKYSSYSPKPFARDTIPFVAQTSSVSPKKLTVLDLSHNENLGIGRLQTVIANLEKNSSIRELNLSGNGLGDLISMQALIKGLEKSQIIIFEFSENNLGPEGAALLAEWLKENKSLKELNLSHNQLGPYGIDLLAKSLAKHPTLKKLNLDNNALEDKGIEILAKNLINHPSLEYLSLEHNKFHNEGAKVLLDFIKDNSRKNSLLHEIKISKDGFISDLFHRTIQTAIRLWCYLPSQERMLRSHLNENGKFMILLDSEVTLLEKIIQFTKENVTSLDVNEEKYSVYRDFLESGKEELEKNASRLLKERGNDLIVEQEINAKIAGICANYEDINIKLVDISALMAHKQKLQNTYNSYMEQNIQYTDQLSQIQEEYRDIDVWKLLLEPTDSKYNKNPDSQTNSLLLRSAFTVIGSGASMASSSAGHKDTTLNHNK